MFGLSTPNALNTVVGIGPTLGLIRMSESHSIAEVSRSTGYQSATIKSIENGSGSLQALQKISESLDVDVEIVATSKTGTVSLNIAELHQYIKSTRQLLKITYSDLARTMGIKYNSLIVFESTERPTVVSAARYLEGLGVTTHLKFKVHGETFVPKILIPRTNTVSKKPAETFLHSISTELTKLRLNANLSKSKLAESGNVSITTVTNIEQGQGSMASVCSYARGLNKNVVIIMTNSTGNVSEVSDPMKLAHILDVVRHSRKISHYDMAKLVGSTFRAVRVFSSPGSSPHVKSIERYASALGITLDFRFEDIASNRVAA